MARKKTVKVIIFCLLESGLTASMENYARGIIFIVRSTTVFCEGGSFAVTRFDSGGWAQRRYKNQLGSRPFALARKYLDFREVSIVARFPRSR